MATTTWIRSSFYLFLHSFFSGWLKPIFMIPSLVIWVSLTSIGISAPLLNASATYFMTNVRCLAAIICTPSMPIAITLAVRGIDWKKSISSVALMNMISTMKESIVATLFVRPCWTSSFKLSHYPMNSICLDEMTSNWDTESICTAFITFSMLNVDSTLTILNYSLIFNFCNLAWESLLVTQWLWLHHCSS